MHLTKTGKQLENKAENRIDHRTALGSQAVEPNQFSFLGTDAGVRELQGLGYFSITVSLCLEIKVLAERDPPLGQGREVIMVYSQQRLFTIRKKEVGTVEWDDPKQSVSYSQALQSVDVAERALEQRQQARFYPLLCPKIAQNTKSKVDSLFFSKHLYGAYKIPDIVLRTQKALAQPSLTSRNR